jgi:DNA-binding SARP family transcriptional activator
MDKAMDSTRSMFSDVDRFITLGRIENAISLLEFQIKRNPTDRNAWIKLMAVYRDRGLDDNFGRTYAVFREQFGDNPGY